MTSDEDNEHQLANTIPITNRDGFSAVNALGVAFIAGKVPLNDEKTALAKG